jgi:uncharacterized protein (DUF1778 family)
MQSKNKGGRPPKPASEKYSNPPVQIGRHPQDEIDLIDAAAKASESNRSLWAWPILIEAAKKQLGQP